MDEGYLLSLGKRITEGQIPYIDFYYLRTPLSIYIQAFFISLLGNLHSIYIARILYVAQLSLLIVLISDIYRTLVNKIELTFLLLLSYTISTLLLQFQWYSYDGLFFAGLSLFLLNRKQYYLTGAAIFLAGMSKQNYLLLLPAFLLVTTFLNTEAYHKYKEKIVIPTKILIGFSVPSLIAGLYFLYIGNLYPFIKQSFFLPKTISGISTLFALIQNNPDAFMQSVISIIALIGIYYFQKKHFLSILISVILIFTIASQLYIDLNHYIFNLVFINYTIVLLFVFNYKSYTDNTRQVLMKFALLAVCIQYLSGFNYGGLFFAYMGAGTAIPFTYILFKKNKQICYITIILFLCIGTFGYIYKNNYTYQEMPREKLTTTFSSDKLKHILSSERQTDKVDKMIQSIETYSNQGDYIFLFPNNSAFYYLTNRKNPTKVEWYYYLEYNEAMLLEAVKDLNQNKPKIILIDTPIQDVALSDFVQKSYSPQDTIDNVIVYLPN